MHGLTTKRHEGDVSAMLTESGLSIPLRLRLFKGLAPRNERRKTTNTAFQGLFVLTTNTLGRPVSFQCDSTDNLVSRQGRRLRPSAAANDRLRSSQTVGIGQDRKSGSYV